MKKCLPIILAVLLTASALTGCAGQANAPGQSVGINANALASTPEPEDIPDNSFSKEDYQKLSALQFDDYQHMTVSKFQNKVWMMADTAEYQDLFERLSKDEALYQLKDSDEAASFLFYILEPLTAENWQTRSYSGAAESDLPAPAENARLEYTFTLTILNADALMVKDYNDAGSGGSNQNERPAHPGADGHRLKQLLGPCSRLAFDSLSLECGAQIIYNDGNSTDGRL